MSLLPKLLNTLTLVLALISFSSRVHSQPSLVEVSTTHQLLLQIAALQNTEGNNIGLFPSFRQYQYRNSVLKSDDNIFFTSLISWTLRKNLGSLDSADRSLAEAVIARADKVYARFQNAKGRPTYNYWMTRPPQIFPNAGLVNLFNKQQALPDDLDCTAITMMATAAAPARVDSVHRLMQDFTRAGKKGRAMLKRYEGYATYSTWFGKKMPIDQDVCVLTNILLMVEQYGLPYTQADSAALRFIFTVVKNRDYLRNAALVSAYYQRTPVILYHISRLMQRKNHLLLEAQKGQLIADALASYNSSRNLIDKVLLSTSLMRWGVMPPPETLRFKSDFERVITENNFVFFIANMGVILRYPFNKWLTRSGLGKFNYYCPAYNYTLLLENAMLTKAFTIKTNKAP